MRIESFAGKFLSMYFIRPNATEHQNADSASVPGNKPANFQSGSHRSLKSHPQNKVPGTVKPGVAPQNNVILFSAAAKRLRPESDANFKYPMLECS